MANNNYLNASAWKGDKFLESGIIKSCLILDKVKFGDKHNQIIKRLVLGLILNGKGNNVDDLKRYFQNNGLGVDLIKPALNEIGGKGWITLQNGDINLTEQAKKEYKERFDDINKGRQQIVEDIYLDVVSGISIDIENPQRIKDNIRNCLTYYYEGNGYNFFGIDNPQDIRMLDSLENIAGCNIGHNRDIIANEIIESIAKVLDSPTPEQKETLSTLAKIYATSQILEIDPLLSNFKSSVISDKIFILDTDFVLNYITENNPKYILYHNIVKKLVSSGCKLYIPMDVVSEVYLNAESANKYYHNKNLTCVLSSTEPYISSTFNNLFLQDFYRHIHAQPSYTMTWNTYISNYFDVHAGSSFTLDVLKEAFGEGVICGREPQEVNINPQESSLLQAALFERISQSDRGQARSDEHNNNIARVDTQLYLSVKLLNQLEADKGNTMKGKLLNKRYYLLSNTIRIHKCAEELGLAEKVICSPDALSMFLESYANKDLDQNTVLDLFGNPFLVHVANAIKDDIEDILMCGVDVKGKKIVRLRHDLGNDVERLMTAEPAELPNVVQDIEDKGYSLMPNYRQILDENKKLRLKLDEQERESKAQYDMQANTIVELRSKVKTLGNDKLSKLNRIRHSNKSKYRN